MTSQPAAPASEDAAEASHIAREKDLAASVPPASGGHSAAEVDVHSIFEPYRRISPPVDAAEVAKTAIVACTFFPLRALFLVLAGAVLWLVAFSAIAGLKNRHIPLPKWRKLLLATMFPIIRAITFVTFGVHHIQTRHVGYDTLSAAMQNAQSTENSPSPPPSPAPAPVSPAEEAHVIVANHLGYLDIIVLLARYRGSFVAKGDIEKTPFIGTIATALQCMFVREGSSLTSQLVGRVQSTYACHTKSPKCPGCGSCMNKIIIFPEGTTTNGTAMIPFRTGIFNAGVPVRPVCIQFPHRNFNLSWETIRFREHLFRTMTQVWNNVVVTELPPYSPSDAEKADASRYAANVQRLMAHVLDQTVVPLNRKHKFLYHSYLLGKIKDPEQVQAQAKQLVAEDPILSGLRGAGDEAV